MDLQALVREIVAALVHLRDAQPAVPMEGRDLHTEIKAKYALTHNQGPEDPLRKAAEGAVLDKITAFIDAAKPVAPPVVIPAAAEPTPEPGDPSSITTEQPESVS